MSSSESSFPDVCRSTRNCRIQLFALAVFLLAAHPLSAQLISVDINGSVRSDVTAPGFSPWFMASGLSTTITNYTYTYDPDTGVITATNITRIGCKLTQTYPAPSATIYLDGEYSNKDGNSTSTDPNVGWRLSMDGCRVKWKDDAIPVDQAYTNGGAFSLTISNLSAGPHTITTYHNDFFAKPPPSGWHGTNTMSKCIISANGVPVYTNVPSLYSTNDSKCGFAWFTITNDYDDQPVVLSFDPDHSSVLDFVVLNGFEIDRPSPPGTLASALFPVPGDEHIFANNDVPLPGTANAGYTTLQWRPAAFAISNHVYFGTSFGVVLNATNGSPEFKLASAATAGGIDTLSVSNLNSALTYYWRVDQLNIANGSTNLVKGTVWSFRTRHLAFPTAEGYGRFSRGGRGGVVIEVTNLNDSGPGSYRAAIEASGPRTVVFRVSGLIRLNGACVIGNGYLTVAGQTAPGDGICLANYRAGMSSCNDVIIRFMRCRLGDAAQKSMDGIGLGNSSHSIIDHTSLSWTMDEATSSRQSGRVGSESAMVTFQHNLIAEPLCHSYHYAGQSATSTNYEAHAFAGSISGEIGSYHHNLIAHSTDRNWSLAGGYDQSQHLAGSLDIRNNVVYNWVGRTTDGGVFRLNYVNNFYKSYSTSPGAKYLLKLDANDPGVGYGNAGFYYMVGNVMTGVSGQADLFPDNWANGGFNNGAAMQAIVQTNSEIYPSFVDTQTASNAYKVVLSDSGCNLQLQDAIDRRVVGEVMDRTTHYIGTNGNPYIINGVVQDYDANRPGIIDSQTDVLDYSSNPAATNYSPNAPWPPYFTYNVPVDTDHDGLPDWWERIKGSNTNSPAGDFSDANADSLGDGYTELERYLNWLALPHYDCTNAVTLNVDLTQYTRGFTNSSLGSIYAVFNPAGGTVVTNGPGGRTAQFIPNTGIDALGSFMFKVTDNTGFSYTNTVNIHIIGDGSVTNVPSAPTGLNATAGNAQVSLNWNSASNATSYIVKRATVSGGPYASIITNATTSYVNTGLTNGTTYYYVVSALNVIGESSNSSEVSATPQLPLPGVPTGLTATAGNSQVALSWNASANATAYIIKRATISGGPYTSVATNATTTFTNTGLANGTIYYFVVSAVNAAGESANSSQVSATPQIPAPTGLIASAGNGQVSLSWNASAGATEYIIKRATINGGPYTVIDTNATTTYTNTGLGNGITYFFVVSARAGSGESANSSQVSATPVGNGNVVLLAYEGFNYAPGTGLSGQSGGFGWGTTWQTGSSTQIATNTANGLTYGTLLTSGGAVQVGYPQPGVPGGTITAVPQRVLPTTLGTMASTNGGVLWISFLIYNPSYPTPAGKYYRQSNLGFFSGASGSTGSGSEVAALGSPNTSATVPANFAAWGGTVAGSAPNLSTIPSFSTNVQLVLVKLVVDNSTNLDSYYGWFNVNPALLGNDANAPDISTANVTNSGANLSSVNALRLQAGNYNSNGTNAFFTADELRLGGSFAAVTPATAPVVAPPILGIRNQSGALLLELTGENGRNLTVQSKTNLLGPWLYWTNLTGTGVMQLLPLNNLTNDSSRYFRAFTQ